MESDSIFKSSSGQGVRTMKIKNNTKRTLYLFAHCSTIPEASGGSMVKPGEETELPEPVDYIKIEDDD